MQSQHLLLLERLYRHCLDVGATCGLDQCCRVGAISLVASDVLAHVLRGQQLNRVAVFCNAARPVVCAATSFHEDAARRALDKEAGKPNSIKALPINDSPCRIGHGKLKHVLCQINRDSRRVHKWTPSGRALAVPQTQLGTSMPYCHPGGVHLTIGGVRERRWSRRGCEKTVCTRGSNWALLRGPSTSPLDGVLSESHELLRPGQVRSRRVSPH